MKRFHFLTIFLISIFAAANVLAGDVVSIASEVSKEAGLIHYVPSTEAPQADWTFSGTVTNESGERYMYFFQIQRNNSRFHGIATVIEEQTKTVLIYEESSTLIEKPESTHWQAGNMFLRFNPINNSWVFGVKNKGKKGFNFKVDMLGLSNNQPVKAQSLRTDVHLLINQTGRLNGHLQIDETSKEQFVTAKKAWFRQLWVSKPQTSNHPMLAVLCEFNDGRAFYSVKIPESDSLRGSIAGWRDEHGASVPVSQFVSVRDEKEGNWSISIPSPKMTLSFHNLLENLSENHELSIGLVTGASRGFCALSRDEIEAQIPNPPINKEL